MYWPLSNRAGVLSNLLSVRARFRGPMKVCRPNICTAATATTMTKSMNINSRIFTQRFTATPRKELQTEEVKQLVARSQDRASTNPEFVNYSGQ